jgi:hypothetical protein
VKREGELERTGTWLDRPRLYFNPDTWDGSDVFVSEDGSRWLLVTEKVAGAWSRARIANVSIEPIGQIKYFDQTDRLA